MEKEFAYIKDNIWSCEKDVNRWRERALMQHEDYLIKIDNLMKEKKTITRL